MVKGLWSNRRAYISPVSVKEAGSTCVLGKSSREKSIISPFAISITTYAGMCGWSKSHETQCEMTQPWLNNNNIIIAAVKRLCIKGKLNFPLFTAVFHGIKHVYLVPSVLDHALDVLPAAFGEILTFSSHRVVLFGRQYFANKTFNINRTEAWMSFTDHYPRHLSVDELNLILSVL